MRGRVEELLAGYAEVERALPTAFVARQIASPEEKPSDMIGRYKLLQKIGEGGCGVVWMAEQEEPVRRRVALKVIKLGMDTKEVIARFEAERQALAMMDHPNIARIFDAGTTDAGRPFFVMELVRGVAITRFCDDGSLATKERLRLFIQVCHAIQHAHQKGIIHRDIKPSNILVTLHDDVAVPKVIDFGIAKATQGRLTDNTLFTAFEQFIGTPAYMSPEQVEFNALDVDTRSDVYSLGVLLYELLTGRPPFDPKTLVAGGLDHIRKMIREVDPPRPSTRLDTLTDAERTTLARQRGLAPAQLSTLMRGDLDWIAMRCLEKDRKRRYETASGLASDIQRHLDDEAVLARPPSAAYRFQKAFRRNRLVFTAATAVAAALVAGLSLSTWAFLRERQALAGETAQRRAAVEQQMKAERAQVAEKQQRLRADAEKAGAQRHLYVATMNLAQQAWDQDNLELLRELLEETRESPARGFEWYYWQLQSHQALTTLRGHGSWITAVAYSPDGRWIVTGSRDKTAKVWDAASGRELHTLKGHTAQIFSVAFSPDGQRIATGSYDLTAKVWETANGQELLTLKGHGQQVDSVAFSPDGLRIVTGSFDHTAKVWESANGQELFTLKGHNAAIRAAAFSPDGRRIVTGSEDKTARVWDAANGSNLLTLAEHTSPVMDASFSPDSQRIVTGSADFSALVWQAASGQRLFSLKGHTGVITSAVFSPDGKRIVTGSFDGTAKIWDAAGGTNLLTLKGHSGLIYAAAFSPDGQRIVTGASDQTARVWDATRLRELRTFEGHNAGIWSAAFSPDGRRIVTGSDDRTAKVWDTTSGKELLTLKGHSDKVVAVAYSPDGRIIVTGSVDQTAKVWDAAKASNLVTFEGHRAPIWSVAISADGGRIVTGSGDTTAKVWDAASGRELLVLREHRYPINAVDISRDGRWIVTASEDKSAIVWDAASGRKLQTLEGHSAAIGSVAFSPDGLRIVTGSGIVTGGAESTAKVWDAVSGRELLTLKGHSGAVLSAAFSGDGQRIVTGSLDQTAKVWESTNGRALLTLQGHRNRIGSVSFSRDSRQILTASDDRTARVWRAARAEEVAAWQVEETEAKRSLPAVVLNRAVEQDAESLASAREAGAIKQWLILAPMKLAPKQSVMEGLEAEQIANESRLRPKPGDGAIVQGVELKWQEVYLADDYVIKFNERLRRGVTQRSVAYAVCYIRSEAAQHGLQVLVGSDDLSKVYLNGKQVHKTPVMLSFTRDLDRVPDITLNAGLNVLVFKVVNESKFWQGSIRFTDTEGKPVKGIEVTLDP